LKQNDIREKYEGWTRERRKSVSCNKSREKRERVAVRKAGGWVLRNNWSEVFLIGAEKMYTAAQRYRAEAATTKKKKSEKRADGSRVKLQEDGRASAPEEGKEKEKEEKRERECAKNFPAV